MAATKKELQRSSNILVIAGLLIYVGCVALNATLPEPSILLFPVIPLIGYVLFVYGCMRYCQSKGYSQYLGLVGILGLLGLIVLAVLPDNWVETAPPVSPTNYPRPPAQ